ncbi:MAG: hypothetical protein HXY37_08785 [Chloroflexi bacterium]|nr:hypothetical protein [Chloroflexota bacterium]
MAVQEQAEQPVNKPTDRPAMVETPDADTIVVRRSALARLHRHICDAQARAPTRRLRQAIQIAEHMLRDGR